MCARSPCPIFRPFNLRRRMAIDVSKMGIESSTTGTASVKPAAFLAEASSDKAPTRNPKGRLPESPRKMRAGGQLKIKNPTSAPERIDAIRQTSLNWCHQANVATVSETISPTEPARPSSPSTRLTKLVHETSQNRITGTASHAKSRCQPNRSAVVVDRPHRTNGSTANTCQRSFDLARMPYLSSHNPRPHNSAADNKSEEMNRSP